MDKILSREGNSNSYRFTISYGEIFVSVELDLVDNLVVVKQLDIMSSGTLIITSNERCVDCPNIAVMVNEHIGCEVKTFKEVEDMVHRLFGVGAFKTTSDDLTVNLLKFATHISNLKSHS